VHSNKVYQSIMKIEDAKFLVVDDDKVMMMFVVNMLNRLGAGEVREAANGKSALAMIESCRPDIVLSDIHMSPMDGIDFVRKLRAHPVAELRKTPVLIMSADSGTDMLNEAVPLGIAGYIVKPPNVVAMKTKLEHILKFRETRSVTA
jgi:CheY-like chemotaxis protein